MAQHVLEGADIHAVVEHQSRRGVPQLMGRIFGIKPGLKDRFPHQVFHGTRRQPGPVSGDKQRVTVLRMIPGFRTHGQILRQCAQTGFVEIQLPFLVAFAQNTDGVVPDVLDVETHQLADPQAAVQEQRQNTVVTNLIGPGDRLQQFQALRER